MLQSILASIAILISCTTVNADPVRYYSGCLDCFNFVAPSILGAENVNPAEVGLIVYDTNYNVFRGYNNSGVWAKLTSEKAIQSVSSTTTLSTVSDLILVNSSSGALTLNLPSASTVMGKEIAIKKTSSDLNTVTIDPYSSQTVDGSSTATVVKQNAVLKLVSDGSNWVSMSATSFSAPTVQKFTSGSGTYTTPTNPSPLYIRVKMVGGGGGGGGSGTSAGYGGNGGASTFGTSLLSAGGGVGGAVDGNSGSVGGSASLGTGPTGTALSGGSGGPAGAIGSQGGVGGAGGASAFGGGGSGAHNGTAGASGATNTGGGGGGASSTASVVIGAGGGSGGYIDAIISSPSASYSYAVGSGGSAGTAGTSGYAGGAGGSGIIVVEEFYQ